MAPSQRVIRSFLITGSIITITIGGSLYGAELKTKQEKKEAAERSYQATYEEKIQSLLSAREQLVSKKLAVERQLNDLEAKVAERARRNLTPSTNNSNQDGSPK